jgi:hypothetical protein
VWVSPTREIEVPIRASSKPTLLSVGIVRPASGYGRLHRSVFAHLSASYEIHHIGIDHYGERVDAAGWTVHPAARRADIDGCLAIAALGMSLRPALVLITNDLWKVPPAIEAARRGAGDAPVVVSCPDDSDHASSRLRW